MGADHVFETYMHQDAEDATKFTCMRDGMRASREAFMKNQLENKDYRKAYEEQLPGLLASPWVFTFLDSVKVWQRHAI